MANEFEKGVRTSEAQEQTSNYKTQKIHYEVDSEVNSNIENVKEVLDKTEIINTKRYKLREDLETPEKTKVKFAIRNDIPHLKNGKPLHYIEGKDIEVKYPKNVIEAIKILYKKYNESFRDLIESSKETEGSYKYCLDEKQNPSIPFLQIDMAYLSQDFLDSIEDLDPEMVASIIESFIFEYEPSLARYGLLKNIVQDNPKHNFSENFDKSLDKIRERSGKKIIIVSTTNSKYDSIKEEEFGIPKGGEIDKEYIKKYSGFDDLWGPEEIKKYFENLENGKESEYLFFVRASVDANVLKGKEALEESEILKNDELRKFLKEYSLTVNIDNPNDKNVIPVNDTKEYMKKMNLGFIFNDINELFSEEFKDFMNSKEWGKKGIDGFNGILYSERLLTFLKYHGFNEKDLENGLIKFRFKPVYESYGAYGHLTTDLRSGKQRNKLKNFLKGGSYVLQIEQPTKEIIDENGNSFLAIHRMFFSSDTNDSSKINLLAGYINLVPKTNETTTKVHGGRNAAFAPVVEK